MTRRSGEVRVVPRDTEVKEDLPVEVAEGSKRPERKVERAAERPISASEVRALAFAMGLRPMDEASYDAALERANSAEYRAVRDFAVDRFKRRFTLDRYNHLVLREEGDESTSEIFAFITDAYSVLYADTFLRMAQEWEDETSEAKRGKERPLPQTYKRSLENSQQDLPFDQFEENHRKAPYGDEVKQCLLRNWLLDISMYRYDPNGGASHPYQIDDLRLRMPPMKYAPEGNFSVDQWFWLGPLVNEAAAFLGTILDLKKERSEKKMRDSGQDDDRAIVERKGILIPLQVPPEAEPLLLEVCRQGRERGLELLADVVERDVKEKQTRIRMKKVASEIGFLQRSILYAEESARGYVKEEQLKLDVISRKAPKESDISALQSDIDDLKKAIDRETESVKRTGFDRFRFRKEIAEDRLWLPRNIRSFNEKNKELIDLMNKREEAEKAVEDQKIARAITKKFLDLLEALKISLKGMREACFDPKKETQVFSADAALATSLESRVVAMKAEFQELMKVASFGSVLVPSEIISSEERHDARVAAENYEAGGDVIDRRGSSRKKR